VTNVYHWVNCRIVISKKLSEYLPFQSERRGMRSRRQLETVARCPLFYTQTNYTQTAAVYTTDVVVFASSFITLLKLMLICILSCRSVALHPFYNHSTTIIVHIGLHAYCQHFMNMARDRLESTTTSVLCVYSELEKLLDNKKVENCASTRPPCIHVYSASCDLELWRLTCWDAQTDRLRT